ncbi:hypothetical protein DFQ28_009738 [Apophysomyces sp. BC1034]|nr:hypothetical protein DFQ30_005949 [Apophysomyces sp. BC1015]KAG0182348.1 hypothetical protein DFQ29_004588 [Apophysomyces sp. BC1021]KAG0194531.1 hypothetical protein DFQ28_009738 [Apophysomyces sp. BC1034]
MTDHNGRQSPMPIFVVMGTAGCGKTSVAEEMQKLLQCDYLEGDVLHPQANVDKMASGYPLTDDDRWPWLRLIRDVLVEKASQHHATAVVTCSALRKVYRDILSDIPSELGSVTFCYLKGSPALLAERIAARQGHFMKPGMLRSQLDTLEEPNPEVENVIVADIIPEPKVIAQQIVNEARSRGILP